MPPWKTQKQTLWLTSQPEEKEMIPSKQQRKITDNLEFYALKIILPKQKWNKDNSAKYNWEISLAADLLQNILSGVFR